MDLAQEEGQKDIITLLSNAGANLSPASKTKDDAAKPSESSKPSSVLSPAESIPVQNPFSIFQPRDTLQEAPSPPPKPKRPKKSPIAIAKVDGPTGHYGY